MNVFWKPMSAVHKCLCVYAQISWDHMKGENIDPTPMPTHHAQRTVTKSSWLLIPRAIKSLVVLLANSTAQSNQRFSLAVPRHKQTVHSVLPLWTKLSRSTIQLR